MGKPIKINKGTRQGGLTSPFLFNAFYQDMIRTLSETTGGLRICDTSYNVFCYADDVILVSTTTTGRQDLIDAANTYVTQHGLSFNATKTNCTVFGKTHFSADPSWTIDGETLNDATGVGISYLGAIL